jgi:hypothetical protein
MFHAAHKSLRNTSLSDGSQDSSGGVVTGLPVGRPRTSITKGNSNLLKQVLTPEDGQIRPKHIVILKF